MIGTGRTGSLGSILGLIALHMVQEGFEDATSS